MQIEWWQWLVGGLALVLMELVVPSFFIVWFGLGGILVSLLLWLFPTLSLTAQLAIWTLASLAMVLLWFRVFKPEVHKTRIGMAEGDVLGEIGLTVTALAPFQRGRVRFQRPILGAEEWQCAAETSIGAGERVRVVAIEGSFLKVEKEK